jgi:hypothetical protein
VTTKTTAPPGATATTRLARANPTTTSGPTSTASTAPADPATQFVGESPLLVTPDGDRLFGGTDALKILRPDGTVVTWPLPTAAIGTARPILLRTRDHLLFLINAPGRIVRIRPTPDGAEPFAVESVFTRGVPSDANPLRVWLDPADRICYAHGTRVTVLFTIGRIPPAIAEKMRPEEFPHEDR